jgi:hypothetical protein
MQELGFEELLTELGFNGVDRAMAIGSVMARMALPGSACSSWRWLRAQSELGELLGTDYGRHALMRFYRVSDKLLRQQERIEEALFSRLQSLFGLETWVTLGLVLDRSNFIRRSKVFTGNAVEARTLEEMLEQLAAPEGALVILDRGLATEENIRWLKERGYCYLVMTRGGGREFDAENAISFTSASGEALRISREDDGEEARLYCHSAGREEKTKAMNARRMQRFEAGLASLAASLTKPRGIKNVDRLRERIGHLKERYPVARSIRSTCAATPSDRERRSASPGSVPCAREPDSATPASIACAPICWTGTKRRSGAPIPRSPTWMPCFAA